MSGAEIAAEVAAAIGEAGAATGNGPLIGSIIRKGADNETTIPPTPGQPQTFGCTLIWKDYSAKDRDGTNITMRDVMAIISPDAETDPRNGDVLQVGGKDFSVIDVKAVQPGGVVLMWKCQCRSGDT